jgi:transketolase
MGSADGVLKGGYVLFDSAPGETPQVVILGSGSEIAIAMDGANALAAEGVAVRVVSLASWELFAKQDGAYRASVLPAGVPRVAIEAASPFGWERWVGNDPAQGAIIAIDRFGASAPFEQVYAELGITADAVVDAAKRLLG